MQDVFPYVADGVRVPVEGFLSEIWAVSFIIALSLFYTRQNFARGVEFFLACELSAKANWKKTKKTPLRADNSAWWKTALSRCLCVP